MGTYGREHVSVSAIMGMEQRSHIQEVIARNVMIFVFALLIWMANSQNVDLLAGAAASEWMTGIPVMDSPGSYENSLHLTYLNEAGGVRSQVGLWMYRNLDMSPARLDKLRLLIQTVLIVYGVFLINNAMRSGPIAGAAAAALVFTSCFTGMGRGLNLQVTYVPSHSGLTFAAGLFIMGMFLNGRRKIPLFLAGLLSIWDPVQSCVILVLFWAVLLFRLGKEGGGKWMVIYTVMQAVSFVPGMFFTMKYSGTGAVLPPSDVRLWWSMIHARATSIFPLYEGMLYTVDVWVALLAGFAIPLVVVRFNSRWKNRFSARGVKLAFVILGWVAAAWIVQSFSAHLLHSIPAAKLSLARVTPYATVLMCIFIAGFIEDLILSEYIVAGSAFLLSVILLGLFVRMFSPVVVFAAVAYSVFKCGDDVLLKRCFYIASAGLGLMLASGVLSHMLDTFNVIRGPSYGAFRIVEYAIRHVAVLLSSVSFAGLCARLLAFHRGVGDVRKRTTRAVGATYKTVATFAIASFTIIMLFVNMKLTGSNFPYDLRNIQHDTEKRADDRRDVEHWAKYNTSENSLFVLDPFLFAGFEQAAQRPALLQREEMLYPLNAFGTLVPVVRRLKLLGVDVSDESIDRCGIFETLRVPRCRQSKFYARLRDAYPSAVISNLGILLSEVPNAKYLVAGANKPLPPDLALKHKRVYENASYVVYDLLSR